MRFHQNLSLVGLAIATSVALYAVPTRAQPDQDPADRAAPPSVTPPKLTRAAKAILPAGAAPAGEPVAVLLELLIDAEGKVSEAKVVESAGEPFDGAALEAVRKFEFEPARRGEEAVPVRLNYRYVFEPEPPTKPEPEPKPPPQSEPKPPPEPAGEPPVAVDPEPDPDTEPLAQESFGAVAEIDAPPRETTKRVVPQEQLTKIPGTGGDAMRAVEVMPGVARNGDFGGEPILRGAAWNESTAFIDGVPVPMLYHFGGLKSSFSSHLLERVELYPGNFSARFGRVTGGILDARVRDPRTDGWHSILELSVLDSSALVEAPIADKGGIALAARRSNIDFFFENFVPEDAYDVVAAPLYWDYQAIGTYQIHPDHRLRLMGYGSRDQVRLIFSDPNVFDPALRGQLEFGIEYHRAQIDLQSRLADNVRQNLQLTYGKTVMTQKIGPLDANFDGHELFGRGEWSIDASEAVRVNFGFDFDSMFMVGRYQGPAPPQAEGDPNENTTLAEEDLVTVDLEDDSIEIIRPAGYVELEIRPFDRVLLVPGLRFDYYGYVGEWSLDPRLSSRFEVTDSTAIKSGVGLYSQPPMYYEAIPGFTNPDVEPYHALHTGLGVEQKLGSNFEVGVEGFYKRIIHRVVATPGGAPPRFENNGVGRIYGAELSAKYQSEDAFGYVAYTLSRSERRDRNEEWRLFEQDQTHILSLVASYDLGRGWEVGGRFRLVSGNPETPVVGAVYDAGPGVYRPLWGPINSERSPMFHQLDLRVEKQWQIGDVSLAAYLDLMNAYNAKNEAGKSYSFDYSESESASGLPIVPNLGIRGEI